MKRWRGRAPKRKEADSLEVALKMMIYPIAAVIGIIVGVGKIKRRRK